MKKILSIALTILVLNATALFANANEITADDLFKTWNDALQTRNTETVASLYTEDALLFPTLSSHNRHGRVEIADYFVNFLKKCPRAIILDHDRSTRALSDTIILDCGVYAFTVSLCPSPLNVPCVSNCTGVVYARFTFLYEKVNGNWLIKYHHSSQLPPAEKALIDKQIELKSMIEAAKGFGEFFSAKGLYPTDEIFF